MAELGIIAPRGIARAADLMAVLLGEDTTNVPALARQALCGLAAELEALDRRVKEIEVAIVRWHKDNEASRRLATIPGVGPITASAANSAKAGSPNRVIATCADCSCWVPPQ
jgi:transposase